VWSCDTTNGICTNVFWKVFNEPKGLTCIDCSTFDVNCVACASNGERKCITCRENSGFYLFNGRCVVCDLTCKANTCNSTNGYCSQCLLNYTVTSPISKVCVKCSSFDSYCSKCATDFTRKCELCSSGKYPKSTESYKCTDCDSTCGSQCNGSTGVCTGCLSNYVFSTTNSLVCDKCSTYDANCLTCDSSYQRKCVTCKTSGMYPDESTKKCKSCSTTCNGNCDQTSGICTACMTNYVFEETKSKVCVTCKTFDSNCKTCKSDYTRKCVDCENGDYPNSAGVCVPCNNGNCTTCNSATGICTSCVSNYVFTNPPSTTCVACKDFDSNCEICSTDNSRTCISCKANMYPDATYTCKSCDTSCGGSCNTTNGICTSCSTQSVFTEPKSTKCISCSVFDTSCVSCNNSPNRICSTCSTGKYPQASGKCGECESTCGGKCNTTNGYCTGCTANYVLYETSNLKCQKCSDFDPNCKTCASDYTRKCTQCNAGYYLVNNKCVACDSSCNKQCDQTNGYCTGCVTNYIKSDTNPKTCVACSTLDLNCLTCSTNGDRKCEMCTNQTYVNPTTFRCVACPSGCDNCNGKTGECTNCANNYVVSASDSTKCESCSTFDSYCNICASDASRKCVSCISNYYPNSTYKCQLCDSTCGGQCNPTNGYCTGCATNYVLFETNNVKCQNCFQMDSNCNKCATDFSRKCIDCVNGYYPDSNGMCVLCDPSCKDKCDTQMGYCESCISNYVLYSSNNLKCQPCSSFDSNCKTCATDFTRKCVECNSMFYPKTSGDYMCQSCDSTCGGQCSGSTGFCTGCLSNYVFSITNSLVCDKCATYDANCLTCDSSYQRQCVTCKTSGMYPDESTKKCKSCSTTCNGNCNQTSGICTACIINYVFEETKSKVCVTCKTFDSNCKTCKSDYTRKCVDCENGYYPNDAGKCVACNTIDTYCKTCNSKIKECLTCQDPYYLSSQKCVSCSSGSYKNTETSCGQCYNDLPNCQTCSTQSVGVPVCTTCYSPYVLASQTKTCVSCTTTQIYNKTTQKCDSSAIGCLTGLTNQQCLRCDGSYYLSELKCVATNNCNTPSTISKVSCDCAHQISVNSDCKSKVSNCKYQRNYKTQSECIHCDDNYLLNGVTCQKVAAGNTIRNDVVYKCVNDNYLGYNNQCNACNRNASICVNYNNVIEIIACKEQYTYDVENKKCTNDISCLKYSNDFCSKCVGDNMEMQEGKCVTCSVPNCLNCEGGKCKKCSKNYVIQTNGFCVEKSEVSCVNSDGLRCLQCTENFYPTDSINNEGKYDYCLPLSLAQIEDCKYSYIFKSKCVECLDSFKLKNGNCSEQFDDENEQENNSTNIKQDLKGAEVSCFIRNNKGCQRCNDMYYYNNCDGECLLCSTNCKECYNTTYCTSCQLGYYLSSTFTCEPLGDLFTKCDLTLPTGGGCAICKDKYYKRETDCISCDESCETCVEGDSCLTCKEEYYKLSGRENK
ncbi:hypothetical protein EIN_190680, partial [Entamoeba invadens IP1]